MNARLRIAVIDDHPVVRSGIISIIETQSDMAVVAHGATVDDLHVEPDVIVLDWELPVLHGSRAIDALRRRFRKAAVVVFSAYGGDERIRAALDAGALAYVLKGSPAQELLQGIRSAARGRTMLGYGVAEPFARDGSHALTARETEVLQLIARGLSNAQIAAELHISVRTVKFHLTSLFARLGAGRRTQALAIARERGLI